MSLQGPGRWSQKLRQLRGTMHRLMSEGATPSGVGWSVGLGVFVGTTPLYGLHAPICVALATLLKLNPVITVLASAYSIPPLFPLLVLASLQLGNLATQGELLPISLNTLETLDPYKFAAAWAVGSAILGSILGALSGLSAMAMARLYRRRRSV